MAHGEGCAEQRGPSEKDPPMLVNLDSGKTLACRIRVAGSFWSRFLGLMGRSCLSDGEGLFLVDCPAVHTCFMRFSIDVAYVDADMRVVAVYEAVSPWRLVARAPNAVHTVELPAGTLRATCTSVGHRLRVS